jgi:hypothetical protein
VDTGAAYSVFPHKSPSTSSGPQLTGAGGQAIECWGERKLRLCFHGRRFDWTFLLANVQLPILGTDFLRHFQLVVDLAAGQLLDSTTMERFGPATTVDGSSLMANVKATPPEFRDLFSEFQDVANPTGSIPVSKHGVEHILETTGRPVTAKFRRLDPEKFQAAKSDFLKMEKEGIIRRSRSCWASPLHMVRKADGSWRPCGDYGRLNLVTVADKYPVPNMQDLSARLHQLLPDRRGGRPESSLSLRSHGRGTPRPLLAPGRVASPRHTLGVELVLLGRRCCGDRVVFNRII